MHSHPSSGQSSAFVQTREQKPRGLPSLSSKRTHLPSAHSLLSVQSLPIALVPPPPELLLLVDELLDDSELSVESVLSVAPELPELPELVEAVEGPRSSLLLPHALRTTRRANAEIRACMEKAPFPSRRDGYFTV